MKKIALIGVGNILFADDGVGVYAADYLKHNYRYEPAIEIIDGGVLGLNLMHYFLEYEEILILDTLSIEESSGTIYQLPSDALLGLGNSRKTVHEIEVIQMIEIGTLMGVETVVSVIGIIPEDIQSVEIDLSPVLKNEFGTLIQTVLNVLQKRGITITQKEPMVSLSDVIESYRNPTLRAG